MSEGDDALSSDFVFERYTLFEMAGKRCQGGWSFGGVVREILVREAETEPGAGAGVVVFENKREREPPGTVDGRGSSDGGERW